MQNFEGVFSRVKQIEKHEEVDGITAVQRAQRAEQGIAEDDGEEHHAPAKPQTVVNDGERVGRNDQCPCGSGKKYKKCCGA